MVETRRGTQTDAAPTETNRADGRKPVDPSLAKGQPRSDDKKRKRKQGSDEQESTNIPKKNKSSSKKASSVEKDIKMDQDREAEVAKPRLTSPELEFDYDRSQLRDPRETPGRKRRPRYDDLDIPEDLKASLLRNFHIPKPEKPKGRLNWMQKDKIFAQECLLNPMESFHDLEMCHRKGSKGSPTYDRAGFELDWKKVDDWRKPKAYNKSSMVNGMQRHLEKKAQEDKEMCQIFFKGDIQGHDSTMIDYLKDHVSKDLGLPWHQIGPKELRQWEKKGFEKQDYGTWWHEPNKEEQKRMGIMHGGCLLRKDL